MRASRSPTCAALAAVGCPPRVRRIFMKLARNSPPRFRNPRDSSRRPRSPPGSAVAYACTWLRPLSPASPRQGRGRGASSRTSRRPIGTHLGGHRPRQRQRKSNIRRRSVDRRRGELAVGAYARSAPAKPLSRWAPSQNGLRADCPQRQKAIAGFVESIVNSLPSASITRTDPSTTSGPLSRRRMVTE